MIAIQEAMMNLDCGMSIVGKSLLTFKQLREFVSSESKGHKRFIVVKEGDNAKIIRIPDNSDTEVFFKQIKTVEKTNDYKIRSTAESLDSVIDNYLAKSWASAQKSCKIISEEMKNKRQIPLSYIQSYTSNMAAYRREGSRAKVVLIGDIAMNPRLIPLDKKTTKMLYGTTVQIYKINV